MHNETSDADLILGEKSERNFKFIEAAPLLSLECDLCQHPLLQDPIKEGNLSFCCSGCQAVFAILSMKGEVANFQDNPLFHRALQAGLISNPSLIAQINAKKASLDPIECTKFYFEISNMWCPSCAELIHLVVLQEKGVKNCYVDYTTDLASIEFSPLHVSRERLFRCIEALGYTPSLLEKRQHLPIPQILYIRFIVAAFCALNAMMFAYPLYATYLDGNGENYDSLFAWLSFGIACPAVVFSGWPIFRRFFSGLRIGILGMEALVSLGVFSAFLLSTFELLSGSSRIYFDSMAVILAFVLLGKIIENKAKFSAKESLFRLNLSLPKRGRKQIKNGSFVFVPIKDLRVDDVIEVRMGETIVLDGIVCEGEGICNEALMTGESLPVIKKTESKVIGGTVLQNGHLIIRVTSDPQESALQCVIDIIEQQMKGKVTYLRPVDKLAAWLVPVVVLLASVTAIAYWFFSISDGSYTPWQTGLLRAVSILLISCPCAIGIAAPLAESYLIRALASYGAIVRNRACLRYLGAESVLVFDKTGTITEGKFSVIEGLQSLSKKHKSILKAMTERSNHPIAYAISQSLEKEKFITLDMREEIPGKGIRGIYGNFSYLLGSEKFLHEQGIQLSVTSREGEEILTYVYFAKVGEFVTKLTLGDRLKNGVKEALSALHPTQTVLLSGDHTTCVSQVAKLCGFQDWVGQALPLDKQQYVEKLMKQGEIVCFVGDGVNDSPALATAHVTISVATAADISVQVSDILMTNDKLLNLSKIRALAKKGRRIISQNLFWAFFYNIIGIGLAVFGWLSPLFAAFAMTASSLIVLFNSMRLR